MSAVGIDSGIDLAAARGGADEISRRLESLPASSYLWRLVVLLSLGGCFEIYDLFLTGYIAPGLNKSGLLTTTTQAFFGFSGIGAFVAATFAGLFVGTFFLGFLADRFGRRSIFTWALLGYSAASVLMACQTTSGGVLLWRFIAGIGIGVEIITIDAYITELVPSWMRGRAFAVNQAVMFTAVPIVAALAWWLVPLSPYGIEGWRWVVLIGAAASMVIWVLRLLRAGKPALAGASWPNRGSGQDPARCWNPRPARPARPGKIADTAPARAATSDRLCRSVQAALSVAGRAVHGVQSLPGLRLLRFRQLGADAAGREGHHGDQEPAIFLHRRLRLSDRAAARRELCRPLRAQMDHLRRVRRDHRVRASLFAQLTLPALLILCGVLLTAANMTMSYAYHAYQTEVFPTSVRARASGLVYSMSRVSAMFSGFIVAYMLREGGVSGVFGLITAAMVVVIVAIATFGPNVRGKPLDA